MRVPAGASRLSLPGRGAGYDADSQACDGFRGGGGGEPAGTEREVARLEASVSGQRRAKGGDGQRSGRGMIRMIGWLILLLGALSLVTWRQPRGIEQERALRALEADRAIAEAERIESLRRIEELRSRARIVRVASERLGMHVPEDSEIVFLPRVEQWPTGERPQAGDEAGAERVASARGVR